ncbi:HEPN domain-containing protein [Amphritea sp.]|uniref:HEPN domain-containing protein n=1 Tax=Amphritea sp. TaxID=1872502 RepID=UPI003A9091B3
MSEAYNNFQVSIRDAEQMLAFFDQLNKENASVNDPEVLKRGALIMTLTAWETYVEDRVKEEVDCRLRALDGSQVANFVKGQLDQELKTFHNPNSRKTKKLFEDFVGKDVTEFWRWPGIDVEAARTKLNEWISKRGDAVHRSITDKQGSHLVGRNDMEKCIKFFKQLVIATDEAI